MTPVTRLLILTIFLWISIVSGYLRSGNKRGIIIGIENCLIGCWNNTCANGYLPYGCPSCECSPNPCLFTACPPGFRCEPQDSQCPYGVNCPKVGSCVQDPASPVIQPCGCQAKFNPVCGFDGRNYHNDCMRRCAGVLKVKDGFCPCKCPPFYAPVCAENDRTYQNECSMECAGFKLKHKGPCGCRCGDDDNPVCGVDGQTYKNLCLLNCAGVPLLRPSACDCTKKCTSVFSPVCGLDLRTYQNDCYRECANVGRRHWHPCPILPGTVARGATAFATN